MKTIHFLFALLALGGLAHAGAAQTTEATEIQDHDELVTRVKTFIKQQLGDTLDNPPDIEVSPPDPRLRLADCSRKLEVFLPEGSWLRGKSIIGVRCLARPGWKIFMTAEVHVYEKVAVAATALKRGEMLGREDIRMVDYDTSRLGQGYFSGPGEVVGMVVKRNVVRGTPLTPNMVSAPKLVKRGQKITLLAQNRLLRIRASGTALSDGHQGERIQVRNERSGKVVEGIVTAVGLVEFPL